MKIFAFLCAIVLAAAAPANADFFISNNGSHTLEHIYMSPPSQDSWGSDLLWGYLYPGQYWHPASDSTWACHEDISISWTDGYSYTWSNWNTCGSNMNLTY